MRHLLVPFLGIAAYGGAFLVFIGENALHNHQFSAFAAAAMIVGFVGLFLHEA